MLFGRKPFQAVFFSCCKYKPPFFKKLQNYYLTCLRFVKRAMLLLFCVSFFDVNILNIYGWGASSTWGSRAGLGRILLVGGTGYPRA